MIKFNIFTLFAFLAMLVLASSCADNNSTGFGGPLTGIDISGRWRPLDLENRHIYYNEFKDGKFAAYTADGRNTLALGSYILTPTGALVQYFSEAQKREVRSVCVFETKNHLACMVENEQTIRLKRY